MSHVDLHPFIKAFEIVSDRLSNLEEMLLTVKDAQLMTESLRYGILNNTLFGFPRTCQVERNHEKQHQTSGEAVHLEQVSSVIVSLEFRQEGCTCPSRQRQGGYLGDMEEFYDTNGIGITTVDSNLISAHTYLEHEMHERQLRKIHGRENVATSVDLFKIGFPDFCLDIAFHAKHQNVTIPDIFEACRKICEYLHPNRACWESVSVTKCWDSCLDIIRTVDCLKNAGTSVKPELEDARKSALQRWKHYLTPDRLSVKEYIASHPSLTRIDVSQVEDVLSGVQN